MPTLAEMNKVADRKRRNAEVMQDIPVWSSKDDDIIDADFYEELESKIAANNDVKPKRRKSSVRRAVSNVVNNVSNINNTFSQKVPKVAPLPSNDDVVEILQQQTALMADQANNTAQIADSVSNVYALFKELNKDKLSPKMQQIGGVQNPAANQVKFDEDALARAIAKALQAQGGSLFDSIASMLGGGGEAAGKKGKKGGRVRGGGKVGRVLGAVKEAVSNAPSKLFGAAAGGLSAARAGAAKLGSGATSAISDLAEKVKLSPKLQQMGGGRFGKLLGMGASLFRSPVGQMAAAGLGGAAIGYGGGAAVSAMGGGGTATDLSNIRGDSSAVNHAMKLLGKGGQISPEQAKNLKLGSVSEVFESGGRGVSTISTGRGDHGGVSYGKHQLASRNGSMSRFLRSDQGAKFAEHFQGLTPGSAAFNEAYKKLASGENSKAFEDAQHHYIKATHYDPLAAKVAKETGLDVNKRSNALQELIFSTSTQFGGHTGVVSRALKGKDVSKMTDAEIISAIQDNKRDNVNNDFRSSKADVRAGVARRTMNEKDVLLKILAAEEEAKKQEAIAETQKQATEKEGGVSVADASQMTAKQPTDVSAPQTTQTTQPVGIYPTASTGAAVAGAAAVSAGAAAIESGVTKGANKALGRAPVAAATTTAGKIGAKAVPVLGAGVSAYDAYTVLKNDQLSREEKERELSGIGGGMAGAAAGAAVGSFVPVVGTIAGGVVGYIVGEQGVKLIYDYAFGTPEEQAQRKLLEGAVPAPSVSADSLTNGPLASSPAGKAYNDAMKLVTDPAAAKEAFGAEKGSENPLMMKPGYTAPASLVAKDSKAANAEVSANIDHAKKIEEAKAAAPKAAAAPKPAEVKPQQPEKAAGVKPSVSPTAATPKPQAPVASTQAAVKPAETNAQTLKPELQTVTANALAPTMQQTQPGMKQAAGKPTVEKPGVGAKPIAETKAVADSIVPQTQTPTMQNPMTATGTTGMPSAIPSAMAAGAAALGSAVTGLEGISIQQQQLQVQQQQLQALQALAGKGGEMPGKGEQGKDAKAPNEPQVMSGGAPTTAPIGSGGSAPAAPLSQNAASPASPAFYKSEPTMTQQVVAQQAPTQTATVSSTQAAPEPAQRQQYDGVQKVMMIEPKAQAPAPAGSGPAAAAPAMPQPSGNGENSKGGAEDKPRIDDVPALVSDFGLIFVNAGML